MLAISRELCIKAFAWDRLLYLGAITVDCKHIPEELATQPKPQTEENKNQKTPSITDESASKALETPKVSKPKRIEVHDMNIQMFPRGEGKLGVVLLMHCDPKLPFAPSVVINWAMTKVVRIDPARAHVLGEIASPHNEEWGQRMTQNPQFYGWLRGAVDAYMSFVT